jgi:hypothetical protein
MTHAADIIPVVFRADFGRGDDANGDGWPDNWKRRIDRDHPAYLKMHLINRSALSNEELQKLRRSLTQWSLALDQRKLPGDTIPESVPPKIDAFLENTVADGCLEIITNGGRAQVESPSFPIDPRNSYRIGIEWMTEFVDPYWAKTSILWLNDTDQIIDEIEIDTASKSQDWSFATIEETTWIPAATKYARVQVKLRPETPRSIQATARIDRIRIERIPKVELRVEPESRIVQAGEKFQIECQLKEFNLASTLIQFSAVDQNGIEVWKDDLKKLEFEGAAQERASRSTSLAIPLPGFYRLIASINSDQAQRVTKEISIAVLANNAKQKLLHNPRVGLSLPTLGKQIKLDRVSAMTDLTKTGALKLSVWLAEDQPNSQHPLGWVVERLTQNGVRCVGVIDAPSNEQLGKFPGNISANIASVLDYPEVWRKLYDPIWRKTSTFLSYYQVGWDDDNSLEQHRLWRERLDELSRSLRTAGGECKMAIPWNSLVLPPAESNTNANPSKTTSSQPKFVFNENFPYTARELEVFSQQVTTNPKENWVLLKQLDRVDYSLYDRVRELTLQLVAAHKYGWDTAWIENVISEDSAIFDASGGPRELLIPLRNLCSSLYNSAEFRNVRIGDHLSGVLYQNGTADHLIIAAEKFGDFPLYLGDAWVATDVWGRSIPIDTKQFRDVITRSIKLEGWPVILSAVDRSLIEWQQDIAIENPIIENRVGLSEPVRVRLANPAGKSIRGTVELVAPSLLEDQFSRSKFDIAANQRGVVNIPMKLRFDAGQTQESVDLVVKTDDKPPKSFVVHRQLLVGLKDFRIESRVQFDGQGSAVINIEMLNLGSEAANFECILVVPGRRREKFQLIRVVDRAEKKLIVNDAEGLRGESLLLRCEEIGSGRVINHRIDIDP